MNTEAPVIDPVPPSGAEPQPVATPQWLRLQRLFRHTLKAGAVNPLLLIVPQYRQEDEA